MTYVREDTWARWHWTTSRICRGSWPRIRLSWRNCRKIWLRRIKMWVAGVVDKCGWYGEGFWLVYDGGVKEMCWIEILGCVGGGWWLGGKNRLVFVFSNRLTVLEVLIGICWKWVIMGQYYFVMWVVVCLNRLVRMCGLKRLQTIRLSD